MLQRKIKIIHILSDTNIGGAGTHLLNYLRCRDRARFDVTVVLPGGAALIPRAEALGCRVITTRRGQDKSFDPGAVREFIGIFRAERPDIVHTHSSLSARIAAMLTGIKSRIYTRHCVYAPPKYLTRFPCKQMNGFINNTLSTKIIAVSQAAAENLTDTGVNPKKISVIINGVEPLAETGAADRAALRERLGFTPENFVAGIFARLEEVKGHRYFLEAAKIISGRDPGMRFLILGTGVLEESLKTMATEFGIAERVTFAGFIENVAPYVNIMDVNVNCSHGTEASSLALCEGFSLGKPAVATVYGGNPYLITDGYNGLLYPVRDSAALAEALLRLRDDGELYARLCGGARESFAERFTAASMTGRMEELYCGKNKL